MGAFREERAVITRDGHACDAEFLRSYFSAGLLNVSGRDIATLCFCEPLSHFAAGVGKKTNGRACPPLADCTHGLDKVVAYASQTLRIPVKPNFLRERIISVRPKVRYVESMNKCLLFL